MPNTCLNQTTVNQPAHMTAPCFGIKLYSPVDLLTFQSLCFVSTILHTLALLNKLSSVKSILLQFFYHHAMHSIKFFVRSSALANRISLLERWFTLYAGNHRRVGYITLVLKNSTQNHHHGNCMELTIHWPFYVLRCDCLPKVVSASTWSTLECLCVRICLPGRQIIFLC